MIQTNVKDTQNQDSTRGEGMDGWRGEGGGGVRGVEGCGGGGGVAERSL